MAAPGPVRQEWWGRLATPAVLAVLHVFGLWQWSAFYQGGDFSFRRGDWVKEHAYYTALRDRVRGGPAPLHVCQEWRGTDRLLGLPEVNLSPHVLLLRWLDLGPFLDLHTQCCTHWASPAACSWAAAVVERPDPGHVACLAAGAALSGLALAAWAVVWWRSRPTRPLVIDGGGGPEGLSGDPGGK
jgi:hypothetical protein